MWTGTRFLAQSHVSPSQFLAELASRRNAVPLPEVRETYGIRLPADRYTLTGVNFQIVPQVRLSWDMIQKKGKIGFAKLQPRHFRLLESAPGKRRQAKISKLKWLLCKDNSSRPPRELNPTASSPLLLPCRRSHRRQSFGRHHSLLPRRMTKSTIKNTQGG